jgi:hypothetical protein
MTINRLRRTQPSRPRPRHRKHITQDGRVQTKRTTKSIKRHEGPGNQMRRGLKSLRENDHYENRVPQGLNLAQDAVP